MKHYERKEGTCAECNKPTEVRVMDESFSEVTMLAVSSVCCEAPVLDEDGEELTTWDLEEARYEG
jgi:hypothetical protein